MELINRYLQAVKFWLPANRSRTLSRSCRKTCVRRSKTRKPNSAASRTNPKSPTSSRQRGRPMLVANRFQPPQSLIGPVLFPIYVFVLKIVAAFYMVPWILVWIGIAVSRGCPFRPEPDLRGGIVLDCLLADGVFHGRQHNNHFRAPRESSGKSSFWNEWDPRKLPPVRDPNRIPLSNSIAEVVVNMVFCTWLIGGAWYQTALHFSGVSITLAPSWRYFFWGYLAMYLGNIVLSAINIFRPYWTPERAAFRLGFSGIGVAICWVMKLNIIAGISVVNIAAEKTAAIAHIINWWGVRLFPWAIVFCALLVLIDVYRIIRVRSRAEARDSR